MKLKQAILWAMLLLWPCGGGAALLITNGPASNIAERTATLYGRLLGTNGTGTNPLVYVHYGEVDGTNTTANWSFSNNVGTCAVGSVTRTISNLNVGTLYYYRWHAIEGTGNVWHTGTSSNFTTLQFLDITNGTATNISRTNAVMEGWLRATNGSGVTVTGTLFYGEYDAETNASAWGATNSFGAMTIGTNSAAVTGLTAATHYWYRWQVREGNGSNWAYTSSNFWTLTGVYTSPIGITNYTVIVSSNGVVQAPTNFLQTNNIARSDTFTNATNSLQTQIAAATNAHTVLSNAFTITSNQLVAVSNVAALGTNWAANASNTATVATNWVGNASNLAVIATNWVANASNIATWASNNFATYTVSTNAGVWASNQVVIATNWIKVTSGTVVNATNWIGNLSNLVTDVGTTAATAYGWGDHSAAGYLTSAGGTSSFAEVRVAQTMTNLGPDIATNGGFSNLMYWVYSPAVTWDSNATYGSRVQFPMAQSDWCTMCSTTAWGWVTGKQYRIVWTQLVSSAETSFRLEISLGGETQRFTTAESAWKTSTLTYRFGSNLTFNVTSAANNVYIDSVSCVECSNGDAAVAGDLFVGQQIYGPAWTALSNMAVIGTNWGGVLSNLFVNYTNGLWTNFYAITGAVDFLGSTNWNGATGWVDHLTATGLHSVTGWFNALNATNLNGATAWVDHATVTGLHSVTGWFDVFSVTTYHGATSWIDYFVVSNINASTVNIAGVDFAGAMTLASNTATWGSNTAVLGTNWAHTVSGLVVVATNAHTVLSNVVNDTTNRYIVFTNGYTIWTNAVVGATNNIQDQIAVATNAHTVLSNVVNDTTNRYIVFTNGYTTWTNVMVTATGSQQTAINALQGSNTAITNLLISGYMDTNHTGDVVILGKLKMLGNVDMSGSYYISNCVRIGGEAGMQFLFGAPDNLGNLAFGFDDAEILMSLPMRMSAVDIQLNGSSIRTGAYHAGGYEGTNFGWLHGTNILGRDIVATNSLVVRGTNVNTVLDSLQTSNSLFVTATNNLQDQIIVATNAHTALSNVVNDTTNRYIVFTNGYTTWTNVMVGAYNSLQTKVSSLQTSNSLFVAATNNIDTILDSLQTSNGVYSYLSATNVHSTTGWVDKLFFTNSYGDTIDITGVFTATNKHYTYYFDSHYNVYEWTTNTLWKTIVSTSNDVAITNIIPLR